MLTKTIVHNNRELEVLRMYKDVSEAPTDSPLKATECRFVRWVKKGMKNNDTHLVCLVHHYENGDMVKELKLVSNYKRPIWVTKELHRTYKDKKEFEKVDRLEEIRTTQSNLEFTLCKALNIQPTHFNIRNLKNNPYIYGYDVPSISFIKHHYMLKSNNYISSYKVVNLDLEFDISGKYNDITVLTLSCNGYRHTAVLKRMLLKYTQDEDEMIDMIKTKSIAELPDSPAKQNAKIYNVTIHNNDLDLMLTIFEILHTIGSDFVTIHNLVYDISRIYERCEYWGLNPGELFSDPSIPSELRQPTFRAARASKMKKGVNVSIPIEEQWTSIDIFAKFMIMDTMTTFAFIRQAQGKLVGGYSLQNLLVSHDVDGKLNYEDENTRNLPKRDWHIYMSEHKPLEYIIYGEQDTVAMTNLENKIEDFTTALPIFTGIADFLRYNSSTHRAICNFHLENSENGYIVGTTPKDPVDRSYLGTDNWIKTLPSNHIQDIGLRITNIPNLPTTITNSGIDLDCVSSYPNGIQVGNVSSSTVRAEILSIGDIPKQEFKDNNINLISSNANSLAYGRKMLNLPDPLTMVKLAREKHKLKGV